MLCNPCTVARVLCQENQNCKHTLSEKLTFTIAEMGTRQNGQTDHNTKHTLHLVRIITQNKGKKYESKLSDLQGPLQYCPRSEEKFRTTFVVNTHVRE